jgi:predicted transcriptional regulator
MAVPDQQPEVISKKKIKVIKKVIPPAEEVAAADPGPREPRAEIDEIENLVACDQTTTTFHEEPS